MPSLLTNQRHFGPVSVLDSAEALASEKVV
jgi:hypothetical protein